MSPVSATPTSGSSSCPTCASPTTWPATSTPRWRPARSARNGSWPSARQHGLDDIEDLADEIIERSEAATRASIRALPGGTYRAHVAARPRRRLPHRHRRRASRVDAEAGEILVDYEGSSRGQPLRHQRRQELHARLHDVHGAQRAQPGDPEQPRQPGADQGRGARGQHRQRRLARSRARRATSSGCSCPTHSSRRWPRSSPTRPMAEGSGAVWTMQVNGTRRRRPPVHHGDVHLRRWSRRPGHQARPVGDARTRPGSPPCRSRWSRPAPPSASIASSCGPDRAAPARSRAGWARRSSSPSTRPGRGS